MQDHTLGSLSDTYIASVLAVSAFALCTRERYSADVLSLLH